jgi:hypothetical protein
VFFEYTPSRSTTEEDSDSEYDFGSDTTSECDDKDCMKPIHRATSTSHEENSYIQSDPRLSEWVPLVSTNAAVPIRSNSPAEQSAYNVETTRTYSPTKHGFSGKSSTGSIPSVEDLEVLGCLLQSSIDQDWALIEIEHPEVLAVIHETKSIARNIRAHQFSSDGITDVVAHTSHGSIRGRITEGSSHLRLPGSVTYQEVYLVKLDSPLSWGDCGVGVADASTEEAYGYVVASSNIANIAYIMAAHHVFEAVRVQQNPSGSIAENTYQEQHESQGKK